MSGADRNRTDPAAMPPPPARVVAIGASAGGLDALRAFFSSLPPCPDMCFVVLQHLLPGRQSLLAEILARHTPMPVREARDGAALIPGEVLVLPPGMEMSVSGGRVGLRERDPSAGLTLPVDRFLLDLARDAGPRAVAVILSGSGGDGSRGAAEVARAGGLVLVQSPESAAFDGMPRAALATGAARCALDPADLPEALLREVRGAAAEDGDGLSMDRFVPVFELLNRRHGVDFAAYKPTTVTRRIERRQAIRRCPSLNDYIRLLQAERAELDQLHHDLLIGVTHFFRDRQAFACIEARVIPEILERAAGRDARIWVPGCATGEEVYSLAMLFKERAQARGFTGQVKIFATDVHREALAQAARGLFGEEPLRRVSRERLERWFTIEDQGLRVHPDLRRMVVFAEHDLVKDPPFTRMDLVACRNLLIYLQPFAQQRVLTLFHFALNPGGVLFLGPSESLGELEAEFEPLDRQWKIFSKRRDVRLPTRGLLVPRSGLERVDAARPDLGAVSALAGERLLARHAPPALLLDEHDRVLRAFGRTDLLGPDGPGTADELRDRLPVSLRGPAAELLTQVGDGRAEVRRDGLFLPGDPPRPCVLTASTVPGAAPGRACRLLVVDIQDGQPASENAPDAARDALERELARLRDELRAAKERLVAAEETRRTTAEELRSANEELRAINADHERRIAELSQDSLDLDNLLRATPGAVLFVDRNLRIRRMTPATARLLGLSPLDAGAPLNGVALRLPGTDLAALVAVCLEEDRTLERDVLLDGVERLLRVQPLRDARGNAAGALLALPDVGRARRAENALVRAAGEAEAQGRFLDAVLGAVHRGMILFDADGRVTVFNPEAERLLGRGPDLGPPEDWGRAYGLCDVSRAAPLAPDESPAVRVLRGESLEDAPFLVDRPDLPGPSSVLLSARPVLRRDGRILGGLVLLSRGAGAISRPTHRPRAGLRVLVVEDNPVNLQVVGSFLTRLGHTALRAAHGGEALELLAREPVDAVLMDLEMPVMDGLDATRAIRRGDAGEAVRGVPILALTAHVTLEHRKACRAVGMDGFLAKPLDITDLERALDNAAGRAPAPEDPEAAAPAPGAEELPAPDLDLDELLERCAGDRELARGVLRSFLDDLGPKREALTHALERGDAAGAMRLAHALKGAAATAGLPRVRQLAGPVEDMARAGDLAGARQAFQDMLPELERAAGAADRILAVP